jgi:HEAT repeat protein
MNVGRVRSRAQRAASIGAFVVAFTWFCGPSASAARAADDRMPVAAALPHAVASDATCRDPAQEAVRLLARLSDASVGVVDTATRIRDLGSKGLAAAFSRLAEESARQNDPLRDKTQAQRVRDAVVSALWLADSTTRVWILRDALTVSADASVRNAALDVLEDGHRADDVSLAIAAVRHAAGASVRLDVYEHFAACLVTMIRHDARALDGLRGTGVWQDPDATLHGARAIATAGRWEGIDILVTVTSDPLAESAVVPSLAQLATTAPPRFREKAVERLRDCLDRAAGDDNVCAAVLALGLLKDEGRVPALIELADRGTDHAKEAAFWALRRVSGLDLRANGHRWRVWHGDEQLWRRQHAEETVEALESGQTDRIAGAIAAIRGRTLGRAEWAKRLAPLLESESAAIRMLACDAIQALGSDAAVPALATALHSRDSQLASAAARAIRAITGLEANALVAAWGSEIDR